MKLQFIVPVAVLISAMPSFGGQAVYSGGEPWLWKERHHAVVVAVIADVEVVKVPEKQYQYYTANLVLKATLAGECDPSLTPSLRVSFVADMAGSSNHCVPVNKSVVLAFVSIGWPKAEENWIEEAVIGFMPGNDGSGLVVLDDLKDPRIDLTLKRIQVERASQLEAPHGRPTTKPTTNPKLGDSKRNDQNVTGHP